MIFTKDCGKIPVWLFTVPCEENDGRAEGRNVEEQRQLFAAPQRRPNFGPPEPAAVLAPIAKPGAPLILSHLAWKQHSWSWSQRLTRPRCQGPPPHVFPPPSLKSTKINCQLCAGLLCAGPAHAPSRNTTPGRSCQKHQRLCKTVITRMFGSGNPGAAREHHPPPPC